MTCFLVSGCATVGSIVGASITTIQSAKTVDMIYTGASAASTVTTGKSLTDHLMSKMTGKDCTMFNIFKSKSVCRVRKIYPSPIGVEI